MSAPITFGSVCSGIEAASVAWHPLGWRAAWLAEIEAAPSSLLKQHYPEVPNHGDMTQLPHLIRDGFVPAPDVFCGGTPCQAFSVAGLRNSLDDARGNLTITFCEIADEIDARRAAAGLLPAIVFWENVPGVLNTKDNAFGCFLGALAGEDCALEPAGGKWTNAGCVFGPTRTIAWRVTDAQYFGVAQRRRRVFVVASARKGFDPTEVLFEFDGVRRDSPPSRGQGQDAAAGTLRSSDGGSDIDHARAGHLQPILCLAHGQAGAELGIDRSPTLTCNHEAPIAFQPVALFDERNVTSPANRSACRVDGAVPTLHTKAMAVCVTGDITHTLKAEGFDASEDGTGRGQPIVVALALRGREGGAAAEIGDDCGFTLRASSGGGDKPHALIGMAVRRLTPRECERLQGFEDDYTLVSHRGKPMADGPRYKALGNSWAVPNVAWIGRRIDQQILQLVRAA